MFRFLLHPRNVPKINLIFASSALFFQTTVLYPWHNKLSSELQDINKKIDDIKKSL